MIKSPHVKVPSRPVLCEKNNKVFYRVLFYPNSSTNSKRLEFYGTYFASNGGGGEHWTSKAEAEMYSDAVWKYYNGAGAKGDTVSVIYDELMLSKESISTAVEGVGRKLTVCEKNAKKTQDKKFGVRTKKWQFLVSNARDNSARRIAEKLSVARSHRALFSRLPSRNESKKTRQDYYVFNERVAALERNIVALDAIALQLSTILLTGSGMHKYIIVDGAEVEGAEVSASDFSPAAIARVTKQLTVVKEVNDEKRILAQHELSLLKNEKMSKEARIIMRQQFKKANTTKSIAMKIANKFNSIKENTLCDTTILRWTNEFRNLGGFPESRTGKYKRESFLQRAGLESHFKMYMKVTPKLNVAKCRTWLISVIKFPGMMKETGEPGMYLFHETPNGLPLHVTCICAAANRQVQLAAQQELMQTETLIPSIPQVPPPPPCTCHKPVMHIGQDEAIFMVAALSSRDWQVDGQGHLRPKDGAAGEMFSFMVNELFGFGCSWTPQQFEKINAAKKLEQPNHDCWIAPYPAIDSLNYGKNKEGYWTSALFLQQLKDYQFAFHVVTDNKYQIVFEVDSSSNHLAKSEEGLGVRSLTYGGKQKLMRPSILTEGCVNTNNAQYPATLQVGDTQYMQFRENDEAPWYDPLVRKYDLKWLDMTADEKTKYGPARKKIIDSAAAKKAKVSLKRTRENRFTLPSTHVPSTEGDNQEDENMPNDSTAANDTEEYVVQGYVGKAKGFKQLLWERGMWKDKMHASWDTKRRCKAVEAGEVIDDSLDAMLVLLGCPDFQRENTLIADMLDKMNDVVILSPKCHPEMAGVGVEYCIGRSKMIFRREHNDGSTVKLHENSMASINGVELDMVWKYARRSRDYLHVYRELEEQGRIVDGVVDMTGEAKMSYELLEHMRKDRKTHRNIMEIENKFLLKDFTSDASGKKRNKIVWNWRRE